MTDAPLDAPNDVLVEVHDHHPDAVDSVERYYAELDERFEGGFDAGGWLDEPVEDRCLPPNGTFLLVYDHHDTAIGCAGLRTIAPGVGEVKRMWVAPDGRGRGLARRMLVALEGRAARLGHHTVKLDTNDALDAAIRLYDTHGYERIERYNDNPYARLFFRKRLDPKRSWRAELKGNGRSVDADELAGLHDALAEFLDGHTTVLGFRAMAHEPSLDALIDADPGRFVITRSHDDRSMSVHRADGPEEIHRFGFRQPTADAAEVDAADIDVVLVPGLAFDRTGRRLGHGVGYYDRFLPRLAPGTPIVGVAPAGWVVDELPAEDHDVPMTHLATGAGVLPVVAPEGSD